MDDDIILLAHGSGSRLSHQLIEKNLLPPLANPLLAKLDDSAVFDLSGRLAFTTDSYVVSPIFFPGGDIGRLAVCGTVNDLAMSGAKPLYLSLSLIIEEGLTLGELRKVVDSIKAAAQEAGVTIVTGDTKVVNKGGADRLFINTSGIGIVPKGVDISGSNAQIGDKVILSGSIGDHGIAVMSQREGLKFSVPVQSDCAPLNRLVAEMLEASPRIRCLRDPTRGGLATTLNEFVRQSSAGIRIEEDKIPVHDGVRGACELLGFDPLYVANEGKLVATVDPGDSEKILKKMKRNRYGKDAAIIGEVTADHRGKVVMKTRLGSSRIVDMLSGELLPRIC
ncbi:MAG: hydrogenase expression/formation protein HypE [Chloroflexi bacterium]|nr:hydrogenase expression/formation protein HypE [Chloroflexota bacterium]MBM3154507.1 hydrogenase expression/formation protein HypE [Chloroflexota bacterium]MBM3173075.1 hydrogenase expression/formation protein HypE [Chloroflexota bacterium]MBM3174694.1 hydrogenase expression/formation protein HypE [Chloroflexota bacterium]MBM4450610.1 hydrogenase expression/formation protein HypE [Chloroflexota bacterium]